MSEDEVEHKLESLVEIQLRFLEEIKMLGEQIGQTVSATGRVTEVVGHLTDIVGKMVDHSAKVTESLERITGIAEYHNSQIAALIEQSRENGERLTELVSMIERLTSTQGSLPS
jgi:methyl-accepting chemotaxis protein